MKSVLVDVGNMIFDSDIFTAGLLRYLAISQDNHGNDWDEKLPVLNPYPNDYARVNFQGTNAPQDMLHTYGKDKERLAKKKTSRTKKLYSRTYHRSKSKGAAWHEQKWNSNQRRNTFGSNDAKLRHHPHRSSQSTSPMSSPSIQYRYRRRRRNTRQETNSSSPTPRLREAVSKISKIRPRSRRHIDSETEDEERYYPRSQIKSHDWEYHERSNNKDIKSHRYNEPVQTKITHSKR